MAFEDFMFFANRGSNLSTQDTMSFRQDMINSFDTMFAEDDVLDEFEFLINTHKAETILVNGEKEVRCLLDFERMKEKVYNSLSLGIRCHHNEIKVGDFISLKFSHSPDMESRNYIVRSLPQINRTHDYCFIQCCLLDVNLITKNGDIMNVPVFFEDNRARIEDREYEHIVYNSGRQQFFTQDNELTRQLGTRIKRVMIDGLCYKVTGINTTSMKNICYVGLVDSEFNPNNDSEELQIADYYLLKDDNEDPVLDVINGDDYIYYGETSRYTVPNEFKVDEWLMDGVGINFIDKNTNYCDVTALNSSKYIGEKIQLKAVIDGNTHVKEITIKGF